MELLVIRQMYFEEREEKIKSISWVMDRICKNILRKRFLRNNIDKNIGCDIINTSDVFKRYQILTRREVV